MIADIREAMISMERVDTYHQTSLAIGGSEYHHLSDNDDARITALIEQVQTRLEELAAILDAEESHP